MEKRRGIVEGFEILCACAIAFIAGLPFATHAEPVRSIPADYEAREEGLLASPCGTSCMRVCLADFGAALVPGTRVDIEVYCRSRCIFTCDDTTAAAARDGERPAPASPSDAVAAGDNGGSSGGGGSRRYCKEGKAATAVQSGVYAGQGLEFYGCR